MCGICGIVNITDNKPPDRDILKNMLVRLKHRGPDSCGYYRDKKVALGHTRLSIIDLEGGAQPLSNEDESIWITFNGEIYNYIELKEELIKSGHVFKTKSDTETIVHAYEEWGTSCFEHLNGQWALVIWDLRKKQIIMSRDRHGIRPLYYTKHKGKIIFASEIKAIFADKSIAREFDPNGLSEIFTYWSTVAPKTTFKNIKEIPPGNYAILKEGKEIKTIPYFNISFPKKGSENNNSEKENAELLREHLLNSSKLRFTRSDVPVGAYLSGGIDSSLTSAILTHYTNTPLKTFSLRFKDSEFDEGNYQKQMAKRLGTEHKDVAVSHKDIGKIFPKVIWHTERPILRTAPAPLFLLSELVRNAGYKVVVTGEGADEVLAGYDIFREAKVRRFVAKNPDSKIRGDIITQLYPWMERSPGSVPAFARAFFGKSLNIEDPAFSHRPRWNTTSSIKLLLNQDFRTQMNDNNINELIDTLPENYKEWDPLCLSQWLEMVTLLSGYILSAQGDRMLMANSVEGRFPFLDCNLINFSNNLPARHKLLALNEKHLLKVAFKDLIPESILNRPKQPYRAPDAASFFFSDSDKDLDWVSEITSEENIKATGIFNPIAINRLISKCKNVNGLKMSNTDNMRIVAVLSTLLTHKHFINQDGAGFSDVTSQEPAKIVDRCN